jgi:hypothetical protein
MHTELHSTKNWHGMCHTFNCPVVLQTGYITWPYCKLCTHNHHITQYFRKKTPCTLWTSSLIITGNLLKKRQMRLHCLTLAREMKPFNNLNACAQEPNGNNRNLNGQRLYFTFQRLLLCINNKTTFRPWKIRRCEWYPRSPLTYLTQLNHTHGKLTMLHST